MGTELDLVVVPFAFFAVFVFDRGEGFRVCGFGIWILGFDEVGNAGNVEGF